MVRRYNALKEPETRRSSAVNLTFLGDALDHWKGSLFELLQKSELLTDFAVDPMAPDWPSWQPEHLNTFARLIRIDKRQIISHDASLWDRKAYFREINRRGDLFLDPDTGIATGRVEDISRYVTPGEICSLLSYPDRLVAVYQHVRARVTAERVDEVCHAVNGNADGLHWVSYESASVAMVFFSHSESRSASVANCFRQFLGKDASRRIRTSAHRVL